MTEGTRPGGGSAPAGFDPGALELAVLAAPLVRAMDRNPGALLDVIIDLNQAAPGPPDVAKARVVDLVLAAVPPERQGDAVRLARTRRSAHYVYARLLPDELRAIARDQAAHPLAPTTGVTASTHPEPTARLVHRVWLDHPLTPLLTRTPATVGAELARTAFAAEGEGVVWAVIDSGIDASHPHFHTHHTLDVVAPVHHRSFVEGETDADALRDAFGHGTHVAGVIAGELSGAPAGGGTASPVVTVVRRAVDGGPDAAGGDDAVYEAERVPAITGVAPRCALVSLKVLDAEGGGLTSNILAALDEVRHVNAAGLAAGGRLLIHGVNLSVGYDFDPEWFACGQSPLCVEVDRLVRSGVVVVAAAGNTGFGYTASSSRGTVPATLAMTINDPGNAELAITVGSTHREHPATYGVSYFSSKGPTGDGRAKPDLVAPGEKVLSCAAAARRAPVAAAVEPALAAIRAEGGDPEAVGVYVADSGTSVAAPHVSGAVAAFLSVRREFVGRPLDVKQIFLDAAADLGRDRYFQGRGLVDAAAAIEAV